MLLGSEAAMHALQGQLALQQQQTGTVINCSYIHASTVHHWQRSGQLILLLDLLLLQQMSATANSRDEHQWAQLLQVIT
jgi:hypothetical protein